MSPTNAQLKQKTISSLFWKLFEQGGAAIITLIVQIVMARLLVPEEFGMLAIMMVFVNLGNVIVQSGLNTAIIQAAQVDDEDFSTVFWMTLSISVLIYCFLFFLAPYVAAFYKLPSLILPLRVLTLLFIINAYNSVQEAIVAHYLQFEKTFRATLAAGIVSGTLGICSALLHAGIWALIIQQLSYQIIKCLVLALQVTWKPKLVFKRDRARELFSFGWKLLVSGLLDQANQSVSDLIIGKVFTPADLGFVTQGKKYPQALGVMLDGAIQPVMLSAVSRVQDDLDKVKSLARRALKTSTFLIVPSMVLFALLAKPLVLILLGEKWLFSVQFLQMYCLVYALLPIHTTNLQVLNGVGRSDLFLKLEIIKVILGLVILAYTALVLQSLTAIALGYVISGVLCSFINASPNKRVIGYSYVEQLKDIVPIFLIAVLSAAITFGLEFVIKDAALLILVQTLAFGVVYLALAWVLKVEVFFYMLKTIKELTLKR